MSLTVLKTGQQLASRRLYKQGSSKEIIINQEKNSTSPSNISPHMVKKLKQEPSSDDDERSLAYIVKQMKRGKTPLHDHLPGITTENLNLTHVRKLHASKPICENKLFWACQAKFKNVLDGERQKRLREASLRANQLASRRSSEVPSPLPMDSDQLSVTSRSEFKAARAKLKISSTHSTPVKSKRTSPIKTRSVTSVIKERTEPILQLLQPNSQLTLSEDILMAPIETQTLNEGSEKLLSFHYADHADPMKVTVVWPPPPGSSTDYLTQALAKRGVSDIQDENAEVADHAAGKLLVKDCMRLAIGNQYNDSVISHYAEALNEWSQQQGSNVYMFTCWGVSTILSQQDDLIERRQRERYFKKLGPDLLKKTWLLFPVNLYETHWVLLAARPGGRYIIALNSFLGFGGDYPSIAAPVMIFLERYERWAQKEAFGITDIEVEPWTCTEYKHAPQQQNGVDCGPITCFNALMLTHTSSLQAINYFTDGKAMDGIRGHIAYTVLRGKIEEGEFFFLDQAIAGDAERTVNEKLKKQPNQGRTFIKLGASVLAGDVPAWGLPNLGNTCHVSAALVLLQLVYKIIQGRALFTRQPTETDLKNILQQHLSGQDPKEQEDAACSLLALLESYGLDRHFTFPTQRDTTCKECKLTFTIYGEQTEIYLSKDSSGTYHGALGRYLAVTPIENDDYACSECKKPTAATQRVRISGSRQFLSVVVTSDPGSKDLSFMMPFDGLPFAGATYTLLGFTRHYGDETSHGHYLSYVKGSDGGWYELDDAKPIRAISDEKVTSQALFGLTYLYQRVADSRGPSSTMRPQSPLYEREDPDYDKQDQRDDFMAPKTIQAAPNQKPPLIPTDHAAVSTQQCMTCSTRLTLACIPCTTAPTLEQWGQTKSKHIREAEDEWKGCQVKEERAIIDMAKRSDICQRGLVDMKQVFVKGLTPQKKSNRRELSFISPLFSDGFSLPACRHLLKGVAEMQSFLGEYLPIRSVKLSAASPHDYFVKLNDDLAKITPGLISRLQKAMDELRRRAQQYLDAHKHDEIPNEMDPKQIHLRQLDLTREVSGLVFAKEPHKYLSLLAIQMDMQLCHQYRSLSSCFQMVKVRPGHVRSEKGNPFKFRLKMYNKAPLHLLQTEDLHKSVSMGLKPLFFCSDTFYRRLLECRDTCMSRVELSHYMGSVKEERDVLGDMFLEEEALELHQQLVDTINEDPFLLHGLTCVNTVQQVYSLFWNSVKATSILCTPRRVAILYAKNSEAKKTYGVIETYPYGHSPEELVKRYAVPGKPCHVFIVYPEGRYHYQEYSKESKIMQLPIPELCKNIQLKHSFSFLQPSGFTLVPSVIPYEIQVTLLQEWSNMTPEQERKAKTQVIDRFVSRYMKGRRTKKVPWQQLEGQFTLHVLSFSGPKLTSYDDAHRVIFAYQGTREILKTIQLKLSMMRQQQYTIKKGVWVFAKGLDSKFLAKVIRVAQRIDSKEAKHVRFNFKRDEPSANPRPGPGEQAVERPPVAKEGPQDGNRVTEASSELTGVIFPGVSHMFKRLVEVRGGIQFKCLDSSCEGLVLKRRNRQVSVIKPHSIHHEEENPEKEAGVMTRQRKRSQKRVVKKPSGPMKA